MIQQHKEEKEYEEKKTIEGQFASFKTRPFTVIVPELPCSLIGRLIIREHSNLKFLFGIRNSK